jgi:hypothetical protein
MNSWRATVLGKGSITPCILDALTGVHGPGAGVGAQMGNDILYRLGIHPFCPALTICQSDELFAALQNFIPNFMAKFTSQKFFKDCGGDANSNNPFAFNYSVDKKFIASYVDVFRREEVRVPIDLYNLYLSQGLLDPEHTIGNFSTVRPTLA